VLSGGSGKPWRVLRDQDDQKLEMVARKLSRLQREKTGKVATSSS
jgi:hypothetical protein